MNLRFVAIIAAIIVGFVGLVALNRDKTDAPGGTTTETSEQGTNHTVGAGNKGVTLIEFGDLECPACQSYYPLLKQIKQEYGDDITFQFKHFPLVQIHRNAMLAARSAEAAGRQGKFWEMHDLMYENQDSWRNTQNPSSTFESFASQLELNIDQYKADVSDPNIAKPINEDVKQAQSHNATSTPTFVLDGKRIEKPPAPQDLEGFKKLIDDAIKAKNPS